MPAGRPRIIKSPEEFDALAEAHFSGCLERSEPLTITGLALGLGLSSREALDEYGRRKEFSDNVKRAKARVEAAYEGRLSGTAPAGAIFALKNMGWSDKLELGGTIGHEHTHRVSEQTAQFLAELRGGPADSGAAATVPD